MKRALLLFIFLFIVSSAADCANRYWVGGTGTWDNTNTANWSTSSGGSGGASYPTSADNVYFDGGSASDDYTVNIAAPVNCNNLSIDKPTGSGKKVTMSMPLGVGVLVPYGDLNFAGGAAGVVDNIAGHITMSGSSYQHITSNGVAHSCILDLGLNSYAIFADSWVSSGAIADYGTVDFGTATHELSGPGVGYGWIFLNSGGTVIADTYTIKFTNNGSGSALFVGGGGTYNNIWFSRGASTGSIVIQDSNSFNNFKDDGSAAHSLVFGAGTTQHITTFSVSGTAGNPKTITSNTTGVHYLVKDGGGVISCDYLNIQHSVATPANTWYAGNNSVDNEAVATAGSGWIFTAPDLGNFFPFL